MLRASLIEAQTTIATLEKDNALLRVTVPREQLLERYDAPMRDNSVSTSLAPVGEHAAVASVNCSLAPLQTVLSGGSATGKWFEQISSRRLEIRPTEDGRGLGLFTLDPIPPHSSVCIFGGRLTYSVDLEDRRYAVHLQGERDLVVDGSIARTPDFPITHAGAMTNSSRNPNCTLSFEFPSDWKRGIRDVVPPVPTLRSGSRRIEPGGELCWNYDISMRKYIRDEDSDLEQQTPKSAAASGKKRGCNQSM